MIQIKIIHSNDNGQRIVNVPIGNYERKYSEKKYAVLDEDDWNFLRELGVSAVWRLNQNGLVIIPIGKGKSAIPIARLIMDAGPDEKVIFLNKDYLCLRRYNLKLTFGYGKHRSRELIPPVKRISHEIIHIYE